MTTALAELDGRADLLDVATRPRERRGRVLDGPHAGVRHLGRHRKRDRTAAGSEVDRDRLGLGGGPERVDRELRDLLGLGTRHEDPGSHGQVERAERGAAGEVLQRLAPFAAADERLERRGIRLAERTADDESCLHAAAREPEDVPDEQLGVHLGVGHAGRRKPPDRLVAHYAQVAPSGLNRALIHEMECNARDRRQAPP